jgi:hypothetical protein
MPQLWESTESVDFHNCLEKSRKQRRDFPTFPTGPTAMRSLETINLFSASTTTYRGHPLKTRKRPISKPQLKIHNSKRRLLMLANERGWAFDDLCQQRARYLADSWDVDIKYLQETPSLDPKDYDLMFDCNWNYSHYNNGFAGKYVRGINSHKWERASQRFLSLRRSLNGAVACFVPNRMHLQKISRVFPATCLVREGIDPTVFYWIKDCSGTDLIAGWTGNPNNEYKRLTTVIEPACKAAGVELRLIQAPDRQALNLFYNEVDIVLIGSGPLYEGNPLSLFEAGACGRAVIATNVGAVPETVEDGVSGLIVESTADIHRTITAFVERLNWCNMSIG